MKICDYVYLVRATTDVRYFQKYDTCQGGNERGNDGRCDNGGWIYTSVLASIHNHIDRNEL